MHNMDHMRISGTEHSSVILSQTMLLKIRWKLMPQKCLNTSWSQKGWCNQPTELQFQLISNMNNFDAIQTLQINRSRL